MPYVSGFERLDRAKPQRAGRSHRPRLWHERPKAGRQDGAIGVPASAAPGKGGGQQDERSYANQSEEFERRVVGTAGDVVVTIAGRMGQKRHEQTKQGGTRQLPGSHDCYHSTRGGGLAWSPRRIRWTRS